jgi:bifunctional DNA-binding transcriptional regulator/antitoxin component of YhaV-PrlF toxin-antitoxin module
MRLTSKGQLTIPQHIRERTGLLPHTEVTFEVERGAVRIRPATAPLGADRGRALVAHMRGRGGRRLTTEDIMKLTRG